jgi:predicted N-formylglutamate amidohydrolase
MPGRRSSFFESLIAIMSPRARLRYGSDPGRRIAFVISCEHGGNRIPARYRRLFAAHRNLLSTHRAYDPGALDMARSLARGLDAPMIASEVSRLLIELNRSPGHPQLYSSIMRDATPELRREVSARYYRPYREKVEKTIAAMIARAARVIHVSSHTFTPRLGNVVRRADVGLLYDPARAGELELCRRWKAALQARLGNSTVRRNYPYRGTSDGLTTYLRRRFAADVYVGIELEINQARVFEEREAWSGTRAAVVAALREVLAQH